MPWPWSKDRPGVTRNETEAFINRFPINLELTPGPNFTERTTYTGTYYTSDLGFDMSFRVQCSENYYGPNCTTFCEPIEGVYRCDGEGRHNIICLTQSNRDPTTNCTTCLPQFTGENCKSERALCDHLYPHSEYFCLSSCKCHNIVLVHSRL